MQEIKYVKREHNKELIYYLTWSDYFKLDKWNVIAKMNEMTGIYVLFVLDKAKHMAPFMIGASWYTGIRSNLLKTIDPITDKILPQNVIDGIHSKKAYFKFIEVERLNDFIDIAYGLTKYYKNVYFDNDGLSAPPHLDTIKVVHTNTKAYFKDRKYI